MLQANWPPGLLDPEVLEYEQVAYIDRRAYAHPLHLFAGPSLKKLAFSIYYLDERTGGPDRRTRDTTARDVNLELFFQKLPGLAPHLSSLEFTTEVRVFARGALSDALCRFTQLTFVKVDRVPLYPRAVYHLLTLPALHHLEFRSPTQSELLEEDCRPSGAAATFSALKSLKIHARQLDQCVHILSCVTLPALRSITVDIEAQSPTCPFGALTSAIGTLPSSHLSLHSLIFTLRWNQRLPPEEFTPLLSLSALEKLVLRDGVCAAIDDATLGAMARAWPKIRHLTLYSSEYLIDYHLTWQQRESQRVFKATVHGLRHFAQCCPDLEGLDVPLADISAATFADVSCGDSLSTMDTKLGKGQMDAGSLHQRPHLLERLGLGRPKLHDEAALAAYLSALFPSLMYIEHDFWPGDEQDNLLTDEEQAISERWNNLYEVYQAFVRIRVQEKNWRRDAQRGLELPREFRSLGLMQ